MQPPNVPILMPCRTWWTRQPTFSTRAGWPSHTVTQSNQGQYEGRETQTGLYHVFHSGSRHPICGTVDFSLSSLQFTEHIVYFFTCEKVFRIRWRFLTLLVSVSRPWRALTTWFIKISSVQNVCRSGHFEQLTPVLNATAHSVDLLLENLRRAS